MRLTKQLKVQVNGLKFASEIVNKKNLTFKNQTTNPDQSTSDGQSKSEENSQPLVSNLFVKFKSAINEDKSIIISQSESYLDNEQHQLKLRKYKYDDNDSLNSNPLQDEEIML
jgi:hypothetical protein